MSTFLITCESCGIQSRVPASAEEFVCECGNRIAFGGNTQRNTTRDVAQTVQAGAEIVENVAGTWQKFQLIALAAFVFVVLGCVGIPGLVVYRLLSENTAVQGTISASAEGVRELIEGETKELRETRESMSSGINSIQRRVKELGRTLSDEEGNAELAASSDGWGRKLVYSRINLDEFLIRSSGQDGRMETDDDVSETRSILKVIAYAEIPDPEDFPTAQLYLRSKAFSRKAAAFRYFAIEDSELYDQETRQLVVRDMLRALKTNRLPDIGRPAFLKWTTADDMELLERTLMSTVREPTARCITEVFKKHDSTQSIVRCINHRIPAVRNLLNGLADEMGISQAEIVKQSLEDMKNSEDYIPVLRRMIPFPENQVSSEFLERKLREIASANPNIVGVNGFMDILRTLGDEGHPMLIHLLADNRTAAAATREIQRIGPKMEPLVREQLSATNSVAQVNAAKILARIGTDESIPKLEELRENADRHVSMFAAAAIQGIQQRTVTGRKRSE